MCLWLGILVPGLQAAENLPLLFPALRTLPAPAWVKVGTRLSYSGMTATLGGTVEQKGVSGESLIQVDVAGMDRDKILLQMRIFLRGLSGIQPFPSTGSVGLPSCAGEWWVNPAAFADPLPAGTGDNPSMTRMPHQAAGKTWQALRIEYRTNQSLSIWVYDTDSGILLYNRSESLTRDGRTQSSIMQLAGTRTLELPWLRLQPNPLTATLSGFSARGSYTTAVAGGQPMSLSMGLEAQVTTRGGGWLLYRQSSSLQGAYGMPQSPDISESGCGPGQLGALILPAAGLSGLRQGQILDTDPLTGARFFVYQAGPQGCILMEQIQTSAIWFVYNEQGVCTRMVSESVNGMVTTRIDLSIQPR
jgi:hypothetical protein